MEESVVFSFPYQTSGNHAAELSTVGHVISERLWKSTFDFTEIVNSFGLKQGTLCQVMRFIFHFSLKLYIEFWKYFHSMLLGSAGRDYCKKKRVLEFLAKIFWLRSFSTFKRYTMTDLKNCRQVRLHIKNTSKILH